MDDDPYDWMIEDDEDLMICPTCNGRGMVNPLTAPKGYFVASYATCPDCDGHGTIP